MPFFKQLEKGSKCELFPPKEPHHFDISSDSSRYSSYPKTQLSLRLRLIAVVSFGAALICIISLIVMVSRLNHRTTQLEQLAFGHMKKEHALLQVDHEDSVKNHHQEKCDSGSNCQSDEERHEEKEDEKKNLEPDKKRELADQEHFKKPNDDSFEYFGEIDTHQYHYDDKSYEEEDD